MKRGRKTEEGQYRRDKERNKQEKTKQKLCLPQVSSHTRNTSGPGLGPCARDGHTAAPHMILCASQYPGKLGP